MSIYTLSKSDIVQRLTVPVPQTIFGDNALNPDWPKVNPATFRKASVMITLVERASGLNVLLTQRRHDLKDHPGQISFPGGKREIDDVDDWHTAMRELEEEVGIDRQYLEKVCELEPYLTRTGFDISPFVAFASPSLKPVAQASEVEEIFEVPLSFLIDPENRRIDSIFLDGKDRYYYVLGYDGTDGVHRNIWGATAGMLVALAKRLNPENG
ncbi:MAG: NUDIX hydrolase [Alphaproteobacteria bacterium]